LPHLLGLHLEPLERREDGSELGDEVVADRGRHSDAATEPVKKGAEGSYGHVSGNS